jgi:hypothetical protein
MLDLSGRAPRHHRPRSVKDHPPYANIDTHYSARIAELFTANVTEKRHDVKRFRRPIAQFGVSPWTQKYQINQQVMVCLIFGQISKKPGNQSWLAAGASFFQQGYPPFRWIFSNCTVAQLIDDLLTWRSTATVLEDGNTNHLGIKPNVIDIPLWRHSTCLPLRYILGVVRRGTSMGSVKNNDPSLLAPVSAQ